MTEERYYRVYGRRLTNDKQFYEGKGRFMPYDQKQSSLVTRLDTVTKYKDLERAVKIAKELERKNKEYEFEVRVVYPNNAIAKVTLKWGEIK